MTWLDFSILVIILLSAMISLFRGFVKEALSLTVWVLAFWISISFSHVLSGVLEGKIESPSVRVAVAFGLLFVLTLIVGALVNYLMMQLVKKTGLSGTDRMLGVIFGVTRGVAVVAVLVLLAGASGFPKEPVWKESTLIVHFQELAIWLRSFLPPEYAAKFVF